MYRAAEIACAVITAGLLGWAGYEAARGPADEAAPTPTAAPTDLEAAPGEAGLVLETPEQDLGQLPLGVHRVTFRVVNRTDRPGEVVGGTGGCRAACCFEVAPGTREPVPPGGSAEVAGHLEVTAARPFAFDGALFLNDRGRLRAVRFKLTGVGVAPKGKPHAPHQ